MSLPALSAPALSAPAHFATLDQIINAFWAARESNRTIEDALLYDGWLMYETQAIRAGQTVKLWTYLGQVVQGRTEEAASLYNNTDRERARRSGYVGNLTELQTWGRALRKGWTPERIRETETAGWRAFLRSWLKVSDSENHPVDTAGHEELPDILVGAGLTSVEVRAARIKVLEAALGKQQAEERHSLSDEQAKARAVLAARAPVAPTGIQEADTLFLQAAQVMAQRAPQMFDAAIEIAQTGTPDPEATDGKEAERARQWLEERYKPPTYAGWGVWYAHSFVSGELRDPKAPRYQGHHMPFGEHEARRKDGVQFIVFASEAEHIPQPGGPILTAHSKAFSPRLDPVRLMAWMEYDAIQHARYQAHIRAEPDPWPVLPLSAYMVLPEST